MATITSFEDLDIWKKAQDLGAMVYELCDINPKIAKHFSFKDQIKRAALSISNNISEGFEYSNNNDFWRFLRIAKGSCGEVRNCLLFSLKVKYTVREEVGSMIEFSRTLGSQIGNLMKYLKKNKAEQLKQNNNNKTNP
jgi:four helix bundle protein